MLLGALVLIAARLRSHLEGKHLEKQLEIARQVQQDLLPSESDIPETVQFAAECIPAWRVGGDFYDTFQTGEGSVAIVLGDVSGKGMPAALLMGVMHGAVRSSSWAESAREHELCSGRLNRLLCERSSGGRFASMFWGYYNPAARRLHYVNAGHCPPILIRKRGEHVETVLLEGGGPVLAAFSHHE